VVPGQHGPIDAPTNQPSQPLTAGLPTGPGPGPEALGAGTGFTPLDELKAIYRQTPFEDLRKLIEYSETNL
jgi:hypothetical protein